jgi:hypothetical protein
VENPEKQARFVSGNFVDFELDNLGNIYLLNADNQLKKISAAGDSLAVFNDVRRYGKVSYIDVTNPLKILLYYQEFGTIVMLDRLLNNINSIDLRKFNFFQVKSIGLAYGGFQKFVSLKNWQHFSVIDNAFLGWEGRQFLKYVINTGDQERREIPAYCLPAVKIEVRPENIFALKADGLHIYKN